MTLSNNSLPNLLPPEEIPTVERLDPTIVTNFIYRSVSEETRRAYKRITQEFFRFFHNRHHAEITMADVQQWRYHLIKAKQSAATVTFKLSVIRSLFDYLKVGDYVSTNPALTKLVPPPALPEDLRGRVLDAKEVCYVLAGPNRETAEGVRDYTLLLLMLRTSLRVSEACSLKVSSIKWSHGRWVLKFKVKGRRKRTIPLPKDVKQAIDEYLKLDAARRTIQHCDGPEAFIFQPLLNYRTLKFNKSLSTTMVWHIVRKWGEWSGVGRLSPHALRRTTITKALDQGLSYRQVQMMSGHKDPKTVMRYDHHRENMEQNAVNFLIYES